MTHAAPTTMKRAETVGLAMELAGAALAVAAIGVSALAPAPERAVGVAEAAFDGSLEG